MLYLQLFFALLSVCVPTGLLNKYVYVYFYNIPIRATCAANRNPLDFPTLNLIFMRYAALHAHVGKKKQRQNIFVVLNGKILFK
jgi:hypothetical protein